MARSKAARYNIGAVARLTGVSREKIRIWERRYGAVTPERDEANLRKYSQHDVERLILIRRLVDGGQAISSVANLSLPALKSRLQIHEPGAANTDVMPASVLAVLGEGDGLRDALVALGIPSVAAARSLIEAERWLEDHSAQLIAVELPTLLSTDLAPIRHLRRLAPHSRLFVVYRFAPLRLLKQLQAQGIRAIKAPLQSDDLEFPAAHPPAELPGPTRCDYRQRQYSQDQLLRLSSQAPGIACECPRHLADLVRDLSAFEDYSLECATETAADAAIHREVYDIIARARALVEDALGMVAREEHLEV